MLRQDGTLLQDLITAAAHARAAYGYAMATGHVSSVAAYIKLQCVCRRIQRLLSISMHRTWQKLSFDVAGGASIEANNQAVAAMTGIPAEHVLFASWRSGTYRPCFYLARDDASDCLVLSIRYG